MHTMTLRDVAVLAHLRGSQVRTRRDAELAWEAAVKRLEQHSAGELALAPDVRLKMEAVVSLLREVRDSAWDDWRASKAKEEAAAEVVECVVFDYEELPPLRLPEDHPMQLTMNIFKSAVTYNGDFSEFQEVEDINAIRALLKCAMAQYVVCERMAQQLDVNAGREAVRKHLAAIERRWP